MKPKSTLSVFAAENRRVADEKVVFRRDGDAYSLSNGVLSIHGEMCGERLAQSIRLAGHDCGSLDVLLKVADGEGGWTWYTGSAAWLYDVFLRDFLGFDKRGDSVTLRPRVPADWDEVTLLYRFGNSRYQLTAARDARWIALDGVRQTGAYVPLADDGKAHEIRFPLSDGGG